jgi:hypothetical protein
MKARCQSFSISAVRSGAYGCDLKLLFADFGNKIRMNAIYSSRSTPYAVQDAYLVEDRGLTPNSRGRQNCRVSQGCGGD